MSRIRFTIAPFVLGAVTAALSGCAQPKLEVWTPPPRVTWDFVNEDDLRLMEDGFEVLGPTTSKGRFPASLAVSRVAIRPGEEGESEWVPYIPATPRNENLQWNAAFDDLMAVSEVFPVSQRNLGGGPASPEQIVAACHALNAQLALIFALNPLNEFQTDMIGVLYETDTASPIALFHARESSVPLPEGMPPNEVDPWTHASEALVRARFENHVFHCVRKMILNDQSEMVDAPNGWTPALPIFPSEWPPTQFHTRPPSR